ncbi:MAG: hypothetical protein HOI80_00085 [Alphaproteobacteria bacterium]|jgi:hypothetical protein|nr:hypothetical protein [Alphaproteobacteria bacterium]MBT5389908.1 hypothetical protein [Alphaproteobacteria bacterium]MBT5653885.1 hypothetical protein [Alphaproteobacteria bacterium]
MTIIGVGTKLELGFTFSCNMRASHLFFSFFFPECPNARIPPLIDPESLSEAENKKALQQRLYPFVLRKQFQRESLQGFVEHVPESYKYSFMVLISRIDDLELLQDGLPEHPIFPSKSDVLETLKPSDRVHPVEVFDQEISELDIKIEECQYWELDTLQSDLYLIKLYKQLYLRNKENLV